MATESNTRMFKNNQAVTDNTYVGRVMYHDVVTHTVHVLVKINEHTWKIEKWDQFFCYPYDQYVWPIDTPFVIKYHRLQRTPILQPMDIEDDVNVLRLH